MDTLYLVNLDGATERRLHMFAQLADSDLHVQRVGVDGRGKGTAGLRALAARECPVLQFDFDRLSGAEIGCWLSHLAAWKAFLRRSRLPCCVVIEDDVVLGTGFPGAVRTLARQTRYDIVFLGTSSKNLSATRAQRIGGLALREPVGSIYNTWAYALHRHYIESLLAGPPMRIDVPIDHVLGGRCAPAPGRIAVLSPPLVGEAEWLARRSQIEAPLTRIDRWKVVQSLRRRLLRSRAGDLYGVLFRWL